MDGILSRATAADGAPMTAYLIAKTAHLVFVIAWMAALFYLPRILINLVEAGDDANVRARLLLMGRRLYRFGHVMFGLSFVLGLLLWLGYRVLDGFPAMVAAGSGWLHAKLLLVALLFTGWVVSGRWLARAARGGALPSSTMLRVFNEVPVLLLAVIVWLVLAKPF